MWTNHSLYKSKIFLLILAFVALTAATALAQDEPMDPTDLKDTRWLPWIGCWELSEESVNRSDRDMEGVALVCLAPTPDGQGVNITTVANGDVVLQEKFFADGIQRGVDEPGCEGWQSAEWSEDGRRLFLFSDTTCGGDVHRSISGVSLLVPGGYWVDIQSIVSGIRRELVIRRYIPAGSESSGVFARLSIDNIIEAADKIDSEAVEAAVIESGTRLHIDSQALLDLADSVVSPKLIDLMVAMSFPERFRIARTESSSFSQPIGGAGGYSPLLGAHERYGYSYPFYYAPFGYYSYWYAGYPGYYNLTPDVTPTASGGRVVNSRGYTKVWPKKPSTRSGGGGFGGVDSSSSSSSSGSASQGGYSRGGGASSRTAKPKNDL